MGDNGNPLLDLDLPLLHNKDTRAVYPLLKIFLVV